MPEAVGAAAQLERIFYILPRAARDGGTSLEELSQGHPWLEGRPLTLIVTGDTFRPWRTCARQWGMLRDGRLRVLDEHPREEAPDLPLLQQWQSSDKTSS